MPELSLYQATCLGLFIAGGFTVISLVFTTAPYGRYERGGKWGPEIDERIVWMVMEAVSPIMFLVFFLRGTSGGAEASTAQLILAAMFLGHYTYRSFIYPMRIRGVGKKPVATGAMAVVFNSFNGSVNGWGVAAAGHLGAAWLTSPLFLIGVPLFFFGMWLNLNSDNILRNLRGPGETGYKIPTGGGFRFVTSPNYLGEIIEWTGFAIAACTLGAASFAFFTAANIGPRAFQHHRWYKEKFPDYPKERKALVPFIV